MRKTKFWLIFLLLRGAVLFNAAVFLHAAAPGGGDAAELFPLDTGPLPRSGTPQAASYADALEEITPAVVSVTTSRIVRIIRNRYADPREEFLRRFFGLPIPQPRQGQPGIEERKLPQGMGSGVIVSPNGYILTNNHVVTDERGNVVDEIIVSLNDKREIVAELVGRDPKTDVAVLKIDAEGLPCARMADSGGLRVGDVVFAIGNPMGVGQTVTLGIVSATGRSQLGLLGQEGYENFIQTDASINPGNSGGALVDAAGRLVGINTAIISRTGGNIGIGFAIPVNLARSIMINLIECGEVRRGFLGVRIKDLDADIAEAFGLNEPEGALVDYVEPDLPADRAGIQRGDVITGVDGAPIYSSSGLRLAIAQKPPGSEVKIEIVRDGERREFDVVLGNLEDPYGPAGAVAGAELLEGVTLKMLTPELRGEFDLGENVEGLLVAEIKPDSPHARSLTGGMVIQEINDQPVRTFGDAKAALRQGINKIYARYRDTSGYSIIRVR